MQTRRTLQIKELALDLEVDSSIRVLCPFCTGGSSGELSFSITRSREGLLFNCFRDMCHERGFVGLLRGDLVLPPSGVQDRLRRRLLGPYRGLLSEVSRESEVWFLERFEIPPQVLAECGVSWAPTEARYYLPIRGPHARSLGYSLRTFYPKDGMPKVFTFKEDDGMELMAWYISNYEDTRVVLVEDQISAMKLKFLGLNSIALIGTHLNEARMMEILAYFSQVTIALDADATSRALKFKKQFSLFCTQGCKVQILAQDIKDTKLKELRRIFR